MDSAAHCSSGDEVQLQKPKSRLLMFRDRLLSPHLKEYRPHAAESRHQRQVSLRCYSLSTAYISGLENLGF